MNDIKLALLGNKEAAKRLTDAGVLVPCMCGRTPKEHGPCGVNFSIWSYDYYETRLAWNTRAPILSKREMEMLEGKK